MRNRGMPTSTVIPVLSYANVQAAAQWLCNAFGFRERLVIGGHRIQLHVGKEGVVVAAQGEPCKSSIAIMIRVDDVDAHHRLATAANANVVSAPTSYPYGERQYSAVDLAGYERTFSQSMADVDPASWGGILKDDR